MGATAYARFNHILYLWGVFILLLKLKKLGANYFVARHLNFDRVLPPRG
jgi:hypothetical protein